MNRFRYYLPNGAEIPATDAKTYVDAKKVKVEFGIEIRRSTLIGYSVRTAEGRELSSHRMIGAAERSAASFMRRSGEPAEIYTIHSNAVTLTEYNHGRRVGVVVTNEYYGGAK